MLRWCFGTHTHVMYGFRYNGEHLCMLGTTIPVNSAGMTTFPGDAI